MQQRGVSSNMEGQSESGESVPQQSRVRNISKLKVLGRSHAMREETSPPREPTPTALNSPCIKLTPSADLQCIDDSLQSPIPPSSPLRPVLVLSPPISKGNSPCHTPNLSPTTTIVPSPTSDHKTEFTELDATSLNVNRLNKQNLERFNNRQKTEVVVQETSNVTKCECSSSCTRNKERNHNNNISITSHNNNTATVNTLLTVNRDNVRGKLRQQSSSQGSFDGSSSNSPCLSRDNSSEQYTDTTGVDLEKFIPETLNRNAKDRALMLRIEEELTQLAKDSGKTHYKFPPMSSYQRMLVHRCAAYFGMDHNIEPSGKCVVVNKTKNTRIPDVEFKHHIKEDIVFSEEPRRSILKRDSNSVEDYNFKSPERQSSMESKRSKSFEEREEEYEKVRRRIFNKEMHNCGSSDDLTWSEIYWYSTEGESVMRYKNNSEYHMNGRSTGRLLKVQSEETGEETHRPCVAKSYSFGGYGVVLPRGDSMMSTHSAGPRLLTKQDSALSSVWRLSPSSSGYKTQSQRSESVTPSPTSTPYLSGDSNRQDSTNSTATNVSDLHHDDSDNSQVVWAVTNINSVPKGSVIINPQTGKPMTNQDGSIYLFDPENPLPELKSASKPPPSPTKSIRERAQSPKKRTRSSPIKKTNIATSPILPYTPTTPPTPPPRSFSYEVNIPQQAMQPHAAPQSLQYPVFGQTYNPDNNVQPMYQQPCIMFAPYTTQVPVPYDSRLEGAEVANYYDPNVPSQHMTYQQQVWNQPSLPYYQNTPPPMNAQPPRFTVPVPQQGSFISYPPNYLPPPQAQNAEVGQIYSHHSVPVMYPPSQSNPVIYPNMYTQQHGQMYPNSVYPAHNVAAYPTNVPTPNSCINSASNTQYPVFDQTGLSQNMAQMNISGGACNNKLELGKQQASLKGKFNEHKSSQSSTENSSPAMTVVANYNNQGMYHRSTPETPPMVQPQSNYSPMMFRNMNNIKASTPVTNRSSRSPTPANDTHIERSQRISMQPIVYQGLPYSMQNTRIVTGRGQPTPFRSPPSRQHSLNQNDKFFRNRRTRGNRTLHLPPNGRQQQLQQQQQQPR
ncbi:PREDICTED: cAMP-regulated phosphoprotein 21 isoform X2 [Nicrophorus vespilloides]|uniref:cAMP-regulated phosphoprotein 21 isoform X2 n=1 Tax=Nicrophorus vespilloides TaxID=110193 RepID=A0ABM1MWB0_NICVS|nr:PREDICTED: cAMP-regulated phosphoprotein 21 isoform X2 [Nicrophorus vespilloides]